MVSFRLIGSVLIAPLLSFSALAHNKLGVGSYPLEKIKPEIIEQVNVMTGRLIKEMEAEETHDPRYLPLAAYLENEVSRLMKEPKNRAFFQDAPRIRVHLLPRNEINAFATASGDIYVFLGLIPYMKHQNMLTAVLAHELIHVSRAHVPRLLDKYWDEIPHDSPKVTLEAWTDILKDAAKAAKKAKLYMSVQYDKRQSEIEADDIAGELLDNAGISAWYFKFSMHAMKRFTEGNPKNPASTQIKRKLVELFSDHPATDSRISRTDAELRKHGYRDFREAAPGGYDRKKEAIDPRYAEIYEVVKKQFPVKY